MSDKSHNYPGTLKLGQKIIGFVLWWSERDGNGVIQDRSGNEFYFDRSVWSGFQDPLHTQCVKGFISIIEPKCVALNKVTDLCGDSQHFGEPTRDY